MNKANFFSPASVLFGFFSGLFIGATLFMFAQDNPFTKVMLIPDVLIFVLMVVCFYTDIKENKK